MWKPFFRLHVPYSIKVIKFLLIMGPINLRLCFEEKLPPKEMTKMKGLHFVFPPNYLSQTNTEPILCTFRQEMYKHDKTKTFPMM